VATGGASSLCIGLAPPDRYHGSSAITALFVVASCHFCAAHKCHNFYFANQLQINLLHFQPISHVPVRTREYYAVMIFMISTFGTELQRNF